MQKERVKKKITLPRYDIADDEAGVYIAPFFQSRLHGKTVDTMFHVESRSGDIIFERASRAVFIQRAIPRMMVFPSLNF